MNIFITLKISLFIIFISTSLLTFAQGEVNEGFSPYPDETHEYWFDKNIVEQSGKGVQFRIESIVLEDNKVYMSISSEYVSKVGEFKSDQNKILLDIGYDWDTTYNNKDFYLTRHSDSLVLEVYRNKAKVYSAIFLKPNPVLKGKNMRTISFSYYLSRLCTDLNTQEKIEILLDGTIKGFHLATGWELGHINGIISPKFVSRRGVIYFYGQERNTYYLITDYEKRTFSFYKFTKDIKSIYKLNDTPEFVWCY